MGFDINFVMFCFMYFFGGERFPFSHKGLLQSGFILDILIFLKIVLTKCYIQILHCYSIHFNCSLM